MPAQRTLFALTRFLFAVILLCSIRSFASAGHNEPASSSSHDVILDEPQQTQSDSTLVHPDTLKALRQRIERLQTVLDKVTFGPQSYYFTRLRSWFIPLADALNDTISQYFFEVLENDSSFLESRGDIQVIATAEPSTDLVAIFFTGYS